MKIEQRKPEFRPVTITLESKMEVMILAAVLGKTSCAVSDQENLLYDLYRSLTSIADYADILAAVKTSTGIHVQEV